MSVNLWSAGAGVGAVAPSVPATMDPWWQGPLAGFVVALGVGLLIGVERERRKEDAAVGTPGGIRTHALVGLAGAAAAQFGSPALVVAGALVVGALAVVSYLRSSLADPGITSEVALLVTFLVGALAIQAPQLAAALGVLTALLLASRSALHDFARRSLTDREVLDAMLLAGAALVVLPLMPDRAVDPLGVINPHLIWRLTVLVLVLNAFGYVALRALGPNRGLPLAGLFGGFVSSTATIGAMGARASAQPSLGTAAAVAATLSSVATVLQMSLVLALVAPALLANLAPGLLAMGAAALGSGALGLQRLRREPVQDGATGPDGRAFQPRQALAFSATVTTLLLLAAWLERRYGATGALTGVALGGFADTHSAAASAAALQANGAIGTAEAALGVRLAMTANTVSKLVVAWASGGARYLRAVAPPLLLMILALWAGALWNP
jgi:uncharacterized membrane protein (DUF4010 family)